MFDMIVIVKIDQHPIVDSAELMGQRRVGNHRREMPLVSRGLQQRQPGAALRVESRWGNRAQRSSRCTGSILAIDNQYFGFKIGT